MTKPNSTFSTILGTLLLVLAWYNLMPYQFGGRALYLIIDGVSMQPTFYTGDLVILHRTGSYEIGDIAAYEEPHTGGYVIHRVIAREGDRFTLLGDNKPGPDAYRPALSEMAGKYWLHLPKLGQVAGQFRPQDGALQIKTILLEFGLIVAVSLVGKKKTGRAAQKRKRGQAGAMSQFKLANINRSELGTFLAVMVLASALGVYFAFTVAPTKTVAKAESYEHRGAFGYTAQAPPDIYGAGAVQTGDPIFRTLINKVDVNFTYEFSSDLPPAVSGAYRVIARINHASGWHTELELIPLTPFGGNSFETTVTVDLAQLQLMLDNLEQQTGLKSQAYQLAIAPEVSIEGRLKGQEIVEEFSPALAFNLGPLQMELAKSELEPVQTGQIEYEEEKANSISIPLVNLPLEVGRARQIAVAVVALSLGGLLIFGWMMRRVNLQDEAARIQFKYGRLLVPARTRGFGQTGELVEMASIDHLARVARQEGRIILHQAQGPAHHYWVKYESTTYHYQCRQAEGEPQPGPRYAPERA